MLVLDTDHVSLLEWASGAEYRRLKQRLETVEEEVVTTIVSCEEQTRGWLAYGSRTRSLEQQIEAYRRLHRHLDVYGTIIVLDFDESSAAEFQRLARRRIRIGTLDLRIAAIVLARDATLLSRNLADFRQVPGLNVEDWAA
jgi:tRNA(fMet)-specific endonuclease VapC